MLALENGTHSAHLSLGIWTDLKSEVATKLVSWHGDKMEGRLGVSSDSCTMGKWCREGTGGSIK